MGPGFVGEVGLGTASQAFCDEWTAVTSQAYHHNAQQSLRHHIHGNPQKAFFYDLKRQFPSSKILVALL
jgi:hypothetical protein